LPVAVFAVATSRWGLCGGCRRCCGTGHQRLRRGGPSRCRIQHDDQA